MRFKHVCFLFMGMLTACAPQAAVNQTSFLFPKEPGYLFTIDNEPVFPEEFLHILSKNPSWQEDRKNQLTETEYTENFNRFLHYKLKVKEAENLGMAQTEDFLTEFNAIKEDIKKPFLLKYSIQEGALRRLYSRTREVLKASHILVKFPPNASAEDSLAVFKTAENLKKKAENGTDFNELALLYSDDPSAKDNQGRLGYFTALQMVFPFEEAAFALHPGEISDPVLTSFGIHLIKLEDRKTNPGEVKISQILIKADSNKPDAEAQAKRKIFEIYTLLQQRKEAWEEYALAYSEDQHTKMQSRELPWYGVGSLVPELDSIAFSMTEVGGISPPVRTPYGYHIIRLEGMRPVPPFEKIKEALKSRIIKDSRNVRIQSQVLELQMEKYGFKENGRLLEKLKPIVKEAMAVGSKEIYRTLSEKNLLDSTLFTLGGESKSVRQLVDLIEEDGQSLHTRQDKEFYYWYEKFKEASLQKIEEKDLINNNKEYNTLANEYREGLLLFNLMNELVWEKALSDSAGQLAYFEAYPDRYQWADRVPALIVNMKKGEFATKVRRFLSDKQFNPKLMQRLEGQFLNEDLHLFNAEQGLYIVEEHPILRKIDMSQKYHELFLDEKNYFVVLGETIPAGPKKYTEAQGQVIQDYQNHLDSLLVDTLVNKYSVKINEFEKERIFHNLGQKE